MYAAGPPRERAHDARLRNPPKNDWLAFIILNKNSNNNSNNSNSNNNSNDFVVFGSSHSCDVSHEFPYCGGRPAASRAERYSKQQHQRQL